MTATTTATTTTTTRPAPSARAAGSRRSRGLAVGATVALTSGIYIAGRALGTDFGLTDPGKSEPHRLILPEIAVITLLVALLGWGVLVLLERHTRRARTIWTGLAGAVLLLSFLPIAAEQATTGTKALLALIHVTVAAVLIPAFRRPRR